jgi:hypothetical protein
MAETNFILTSKELSKVMGCSVGMISFYVNGYLSNNNSHNYKAKFIENVHYKRGKQIMYNLELIKRDFPDLFR